MPYFTTGLEGLLEKVAGGVVMPPVPRSAPKAAPRPASPAAPGAPPKAAPKPAAPTSAGPTAPQPAAAAAPQAAAAPKAQPGYENTPQMQAAADKLKQRNAQRRSASPADQMQASSDANDAFMKTYDITPQPASSDMTAPGAPGNAGPMQAGPGRFRRTLGRVGKGVGLGVGVAALGAGWAAHRQQKEDDKVRGLAYAPISGTGGTTGMY